MCNYVINIKSVLLNAESIYILAMNVCKTEDNTNGIGASIEEGGSSHSSTSPSPDLPQHDHRFGTIVSSFNERLQSFANNQSVRFV